MSYKFKILSIDGGGIRGIIPAVILAEIEKDIKEITGAQKQIFEMFDLIAGTSTGGILALGLTKPDPNHPGQAQYKAEDLVKFYEEKGKIIFSSPHRSIIQEVADVLLKELRNHFNNLPNLDIENLFSPKFSSEGRDKVLYDRFEDITIEKALKEVWLTSYDTELRIPIFFTSNPIREKIAHSFHSVYRGITMKDAAMATSAAPTYFPPHEISNQDTKDVPSGHYSLVDGGVFANNPTALAIMEAIITYNEKHAQKNGGNGDRLHLNEILVVSLGTGSLQRAYQYEKVKDWGIINWAQPGIDIVLDGQSESVACQLDQLLPDADAETKLYYRFQGELTHAKDDIDDASPENIERLKKLAKEIIDKKKDGARNDWDKMCVQLLEGRKID